MGDFFPQILSRDAELVRKQVDHENLKKQLDEKSSQVRYAKTYICFSCDLLFQLFTDDEKNLKAV